MKKRFVIIRYTSLSEMYYYETGQYQGWSVKMVTARFYSSLKEAKKVLEKVAKTVQVDNVFEVREVYIN